MNFDVVVIGTGFGGAVTACRLAEGGMRVCMLERGTWWGNGHGRRPFPRGIVDVLAALRGIRINRGPINRSLSRNPEGIYELHLYDHLDALTASGVGGGSLIYTNVQSQPGSDFFEAFPPELRADEMQQYYDKVRTMLHPEPIDKAAVLPQKNDTFARLARALHREDDLKFADIAVALGDPEQPCELTNAVGEIQRTCNNCGNCVLGCMERAKTTLDLTYVPAAVHAGAELRVLCEAEGLAPTRRGWQVRYLDHEAGRRRLICAPNVVLGAGTLGTLRILLRSRDHFRTLRGLSPRLGHGLTSNGDQAAFLGGTSLLFCGEQGPTFNAFLSRHDAAGHHRFLIGEAGLPSEGLGLPHWLVRRLATSHLLLGIGADATQYAARLDGNELAISMAGAAGDHDRRLADEIDADIRQIAAAAGTEHLIPKVTTTLGRDRNFTVHPLGGCGISDTATTGVTDHLGRLFGAEGLYVADGSLYPRASGLPPSMTIAALAERNATKMLEDEP